MREGIPNPLEKLAGQTRGLTSCCISAQSCAEMVRWAARIVAASATNGVFFTKILLVKNVEGLKESKRSKRIQLREPTMSTQNAMAGQWMPLASPHVLKAEAGVPLNGFWVTSVQPRIAKDLPQEKADSRQAGSRGAAVAKGVTVATLNCLKPGPQDGHSNRRTKPEKMIKTIVSLLIAVGCIATLAGSAQIPSQSQSNILPTLISWRTQDLINRKWSQSAFVEGLAIITDRAETAESRIEAVELLHANHRKLQSDEMSRFLIETTAIAKDPNEDEALSSFAIRTMGDLTLTMLARGQINPTESKREARFLMGAATNLQRAAYFRASAINTLGILNITEASPLLHGILEDDVTLNVAEISRPACLSIMRIDAERAVPALRNVLRNTTNSAVFGTAAFAIGQIKKADSIVALVENLDRFPESGSCDAVLVDMEDAILDVLKNPNDPNLESAIRATRHLWRDGQRERYMPLLRSLATTAQLRTRKAVMDRFLEAAGQMDFTAEKKLLQTLQPAIANQPELVEYAIRIEARLSAVLLVPSSGPRPTTAARKGDK